MELCQLYTSDIQGAYATPYYGFQSLEKREMDFDEILDSAPSYKEFMTVSELDRSSKMLSEEFAEVSL
ncbi:MAG: hypothetical protein EAX81_02410 [Candidatus Thorarchaeota archaeon]|nr:hypothetical protein [Candidatus Thorarchaeota archaeon]